MPWRLWRPWREKGFSFRIPRSAFRVCQCLPQFTCETWQSACSEKRTGLHTLYKHKSFPRSLGLRVRKSVSRPLAIALSRTPRSPRKDSPGFFSPIDACLGVLGVRKAFHSAFRVLCSLFRVAHSAFPFPISRPLANACSRTPSTQRTALCFSAFLGALFVKARQQTGLCAFARGCF